MLPLSSLTRRCLLPTALVAAATLPLPAQEPPPLIPMRDFFRNPEQARFLISPDGTHIAFLAPWENRMNIHVRKIGEDSAVRVTSSTGRDIFAYSWANPSRLVYVQDTGGDENFRLFAVDKDGANPKDLTPFDKVRVQIVDDLKDDPDHMIIAHNQRDARVFDAYRIHIATGDMVRIVENPGNFSSYTTDHEGKLRVATAADGVTTSIFYRSAEDQPFRMILQTDFRETLEPLFFTYDNARLYASSNIGRDRSAIVLFNPETAKEEELVFQHPEVDVSGLLRSDQRKIVTGASFVTDRLQHVFFDDERRDMQDFLEERLPGLQVNVVDASRDETKLLVRTSSDRSLGAYHFYDLAAGTLEKLADIGPWLNSDHLSEMKPVQFKARDGLTIHGYLTLPLGASGPLPMVVNVHGGPWARDVWGYQPEVQFLANRGYAVFQINYRGSTGYGRAFWETSFREWGRSMQDDITDGVVWAIAEGVADPGRVGIYGGSYGGYATLAGLAFTPELYACGVDYVGVANLLTFLESIPPYWEQYRSMLYAMVGNPETEEDLLRAASPVFHAHRIRAPLFIAQGANDPRVAKSESDQMVEALRQRGIEVPYLVKDNEGHGFHNEENRFEFYRAMEQFLARHLNGRAEEVAP